MKRILLFLFIFLSLPVLSIGQDKVTFRLLKPDLIVAGENFNVQFVLNASGKDFEMDPPQGIDLLYGPATSTSTSMSWINGKSSRSVSSTYTFTFLAQKAGSYTLPSAQVKVGSATYKTQPTKIQVYTPEEAYGSNAHQNSATDAPQSANRARSTETLSENDFIITAVPSKTTVYEQEGVPVTFKLYATRPNITLTKAEFPPFESFVKEEVPSQSTKQWSTAKLGGRVYYTVDLQQVVLFPQKSGQLDIPAGNFELVVPVKITDPIDDFFGGFLEQYTEVKKSVKSKPFQIQVKPLPADKPDNFTGGVGKFHFSYEIPETNIKSGDSFQIKMTLTGEGNFSLTSLPEPEFPEGFESYDPETKESTTTLATGVRGEKETTFFAVPRYPGSYVIPAIPFSYFDPSLGKYVTETIPEQKVTVEKGSSTTSQTTTFSGGKEVEYRDSDIRFLKPSNGRHTIQELSVPLLTLTLLIFAALAYILYRIILAKTNNAPESLDSKARRAGSTAKKYLKLAASKQSDPNPSIYYEALQRGLESYISFRFRLPISDLSKERIYSEMMTLGISEEVTKEVINTLDTIQMARFTPEGSGSDLKKDELYTRAAGVISSLESQKKLFLK